ncbi:MAG: mandelate racemase/muconate lactonizing enzyme family protein [Deltaproteobacteria bacterium]|nr:mandelate racemase/muconate lactonizing enzyme family protein [Deltaproteobacteria bacterium]
MSKVARVELWHVEVPLPATFHPSWIPGFPQNENRFTLVRVVTDDGVEGFSAGPAMGHERAGLGDLLGPYLVGADATNIDVVQQRLREMGYLGWRNWWIEPAFWDIRGKLANKPVYELLGGRAQPVPLYASSGEVREPSARVAEAEARYAEGFRAIKLRVHDFDERVDERQVQETARALGGKMKLGVDANQAWRVAAVGPAPRWDLARAMRFADVCADAGFAWLEEPLPMDAYDDQAELTRYARLPISGGELHTGGLAELRMMIEKRCYSIFQPDAVFTGGIAQTMEVARLCKQHGLTYTPHTWTNGIGFAINLQLYLGSGFAGHKELEYPLDPPGWVPSARDGILEQPFLHERGVLSPPTLPGLGFRVDERALRRFGKRFFVMDRKRLAWFSLRTRGLKATLEIDRARKAAAERPGGPS